RRARPRALARADASSALRRDPATAGPPSRPQRSAGTASRDRSRSAADRSRTRRSRRARARRPTPGSRDGAASARSSFAFFLLRRRNQRLVVLEPQHVIDDDLLARLDAVDELDAGRIAIADLDRAHVRDAARARDDLVGT